MRALALASCVTFLAVRAFALDAGQEFLSLRACVYVSLVDHSLPSGAVASTSTAVENANLVREAASEALGQVRGNRISLRNRFKGVSSEDRDHLWDLAAGAINRSFEGTVWGRYSRPDALSAIEGKSKGKKLFVLTHQNSLLAERTARVLQGMPDAARLMLVSEEFPAEPGLIAQASAVRYSIGGEVGKAPNFDEIHLAGGFCSQCLSSTLSELVESSLGSPERQEVRVVLHSGLIYNRLRLGMEWKATAETLQEELRSKPGGRSPREIAVQHFLQALNNNSNRSEYLLQPERKPRTLFGVRLPQILAPIELDLVRPSDGKRVKLVIVNP